MFERLFRRRTRASAPTAPSGLPSVRAEARRADDAQRALDAGLRHHQAGRLPEADADYRSVLAADPHHVDALHFLGVIAYQQSRHEQAADLISRALSENPANAPAHNNLGNVLLAQGRPEEAIASYRRAVALQPDYVDAHVNLGDALVTHGDVAEAIACYRAGLSIDPDSPNLHSHLGNALLDQGEPGEAIACFRRALALKPGSAEWYTDLGTAFLDLARLEEADRHYLEALQFKPGLGHARFGRALVKLMRGDYEAGLALYESRFEKGALTQKVYAPLHARFAQVHEAPRWQGEEASGKVLLLWTDQGLGDTLMVMRYVPGVKGRGFRKLIVYCEPALVRVMETIPEVDEVVSRDAPIPVGEFDYQCPIMSLPYVFRARVDTIPNQVPYLFVPDRLRSEWAGRMAGIEAFRVGLVWAGRREFPQNQQRSVRLAQYAPLFDVDRVSFFSLQKGPDSDQIAVLDRPIFSWVDDCKDILDTAGLMQNLDLIITVCTSVAHLAGALGRPVWLLNRFQSEWRWMLEREDSPWYPTMKIFRQEVPGDWERVIVRVASALKSTVALRLEDAERQGRWR